MTHPLQPRQTLLNRVARKDRLAGLIAAAATAIGLPAVLVVDPANGNSPLNYSAGAASYTTITVGTSGGGTLKQY